jgi:hypothetical protein
VLVVVVTEQFKVLPVQMELQTLAVAAAAEEEVVVTADQAAQEWLS